MAVAVALAATASAALLPAGAGAGLTGVAQYYEHDPVKIPNGSGAARMVFEENALDNTGSVSVAVRVRHERTQQLELSLKAPDGTKVSLSEGETHGEDLGVGPCPAQPDAPDMTTFRDASAQPLASGSAPYTGNFLPHEPLAAFPEDFPAGHWVITVRDTQGGASGKLLCGYIRVPYDPGR